MASSNQDKLNRSLMEKFSFKHMVVSGSLIATSKPQCIYVIKQLNGIMSEKQWEEEVRPLALQNGMAESVTWKTLPEYKLHANCRHEFAPIMLQDGDRIGANENYDGGVKR